MERVKVIKDIPGLLRKGDILVSAEEGENFVMEEKTELGERKAIIDYYTVCDNIPVFFTWDLCDEDLFEAEAEPDYKIVRSGPEIAERVKFFKDQLGTLRGQEEIVVYNNLIWFVDWLTGKAELLK